MSCMALRAVSQQRAMIAARPWLLVVWRVHRALTPSLACWQYSICNSSWPLILSESGPLVVTQLPLLNPYGLDLSRYHALVLTIS